MDQSRRHERHARRAARLRRAPTDVQPARSDCAARPKSRSAASPAAVADLEAYSAGVNAYVTSHPLPAEYTALELSSFPPWTPLDSVAVGNALVRARIRDERHRQHAALDRLSHRLGAAAGTRSSRRT